MDLRINELRELKAEAKRSGTGTGMFHSNAITDITDKLGQMSDKKQPFVHPFHHPFILLSRGGIIPPQQSNTDTGTGTSSGGSGGIAVGTSITSPTIIAATTELPSFADFWQQFFSIVTLRLCL